MPGRNPQGKRKSAKRAADLTIQPAAPTGYSPPPQDQRYEETYSFDPSGHNMAKERVLVRLVRHISTWALVEFAIIQETKQGNSWRTVAAADSSHDDEVHVHRHRRSTGERIGDPEHLMPIADVTDVLRGYTLAYDTIVKDWAANKRRWEDG